MLAQNEKHLKSVNLSSKLASNKKPDSSGYQNHTIKIAIAENLLISHKTLDHDKKSHDAN